MDIELKIKGHLSALSEERVSMVTRHLALTPGSTVRTATPTFLTHKSLLDELREPSPVSAAGGSSGSAGSRPPINVVALDALRFITEEVARWVTYCFRTRDRGVVENVRFLHANFHVLGDDDMYTLAYESKRWESLAAISTTWETAPLRPYVPCPDCSSKGGLRLTVEPVRVMCLDCMASWVGDEVDTLGESLAALAQSAQQDAQDSASMDAPNPPEILSGGPSIG